MMKANKKTIGMALLVLFLCAHSYAQRQGGGLRGGGGDRQGAQRNKQPNASMIMEKLDLNNDNLISRVEAEKDDRQIIFENFEEFDTNEDGFIDLEELEASLRNKKRRKPNAKKIIKQIDDNGDGTLNKFEIAAKENSMLLKNFDAIDTDENGELSVKELKAFFKNRAPKERPRRRRN